MKTQIHHPDKTVSTGAYSAGILMNGWLFISGQGPLNLSTGEVVRGTIEEETRLTLEHLDAILRAAGTTRDHVVKCTCHLSDIRNFDRFNAEYATFFTGIRPARTTVQSVLCDGIQVEIDAIAKVPSRSRRKSHG